MLYNVLWVLLVSLVVEGYECNRYRFPTGPYIFVLAGWVVMHLTPARKNKAVLSGIAVFLVVLGVMNWALYG
jgi:hypothetical protein